MSLRLRRKPLIVFKGSQTHSQDFHNSKLIRKRGVKFFDPSHMFQSFTSEKSISSRSSFLSTTFGKSKYIGEVKLQFERIKNKQDLHELKVKMSRKQRTDFDSRMVDFLLKRYRVYSDIRGYNIHLSISGRSNRIGQIRPMLVIDLVNCKDYSYTGLLRQFIGSIYEFFRNNIYFMIKIGEFSPIIMEKIIPNECFRRYHSIVERGVDPFFSHKHCIKNLTDQELRHLKRVQSLELNRPTPCIADNILRVSANLRKVKHFSLIYDRDIAKICKIQLKSLLFLPKLRLDTLKLKIPFLVRQKEDIEYYRGFLNTIAFPKNLRTLVFEVEGINFQEIFQEKGVIPRFFEKVKGSLGISNQVNGYKNTVLYKNFISKFHSLNNLREVSFQIQSEGDFQLENYDVFKDILKNSMPITKLSLGLKPYIGNNNQSQHIATLDLYLFFSKLENLNYLQSIEIFFPTIKISQPSQQISELSFPNLSELKISVDSGTHILDSYDHFMHIFDYSNIQNLCLDYNEHISDDELMNRLRILLYYANIQTIFLKYTITKKKIPPKTIITKILDVISRIKTLENFQMILNEYYADIENIKHIRDSTLDKSERLPDFNIYFANLGFIRADKKYKIINLM